MSIFFTVVGLLALIGLGGLLAATEAALGILSPEDIRQSAPGRRWHGSLVAIAQDLSAHRTVTTFSRIVVETSAAVLVTASLLLSGMTEWVAILVAILVMVAASFVLAGSSPRSFGRAHPVAVLAFSAPIIHVFRLLLGPVANALVAFGDKVTPGRPGTATFTNEEQLLSMVDEAVKHDVLENDERELIRTIFEWGDTVAREVMVPRTDMVTLPKNTPLEHALRVFHSAGHSRIPVIGDEVDEVLGVVNFRDVAQAALSQADRLHEMTVDKLMRPAVFIPESKQADETLKHMQASGTHMAFVVDEYGGIAGLLTMEDLIEELVGEISDEYDRGMPDVEQLSPHRFRINTRLPIDELGELFELQLSDEDVDSVGGLFAKELGRLPSVGDSVTVSGLVITADRVDTRRKRVTRVIVERSEALAGVEEAFLAEE